MADPKFGPLFFASLEPEEATAMLEDSWAVDVPQPDGGTRIELLQHQYAAQPMGDDEAAHSNRVRDAMKRLSKDMGGLLAEGKRPTSEDRLEK